MGRRTRKPIEVETVGEITQVQVADGSDDPVWIIPNVRDAGYWQVFRGPGPDAATDALSAGYATHAEALSAARTFASLGIRRLPRAEAKGVHIDPTSPWRVYGFDEYWPVGPSVFAAIRNDATGEQGMVWLSEKELPRVMRVWQRAETPFVSFPPRRFIPHEEAVRIRMAIYAARMGGPAE
jgi:hypothetical protein